VIELAARNERWITLGGLFAVAALGLSLTMWTGSALMMWDSHMGGALVYFVVLFAMWWTMMLAMMLPSAAPAVLTYGALARRHREQGGRPAAAALFAAGYGAVWALFSLVAVTLQLSTRNLVPLDMMMAVTSKVVGGVLLVAAGVYQLTPLKYACLRHCQVPLLYLARNWREGAAGAFTMGFRHGFHCLGCCWVLMALLFYGGVMELTWIVGLAAYVAAEKLIPAGNRLGQLAGALLVAWGLWVLARAFV
jgi:predicted metal-binding membrane protein